MSPVSRGRHAGKLGYRWENAMTHRICSIPDFDAVRIGGPSVALPDIIAHPLPPVHRDLEPNLWYTAVVECKATSRRKAIAVPRHQVRALWRWARGPLCGSTTSMWIACRWTPSPATKVEWFVRVPPEFDCDAHAYVSMDGGIRGLRARGGGAPAAGKWHVMRDALEAME